MEKQRKESRCFDIKTTITERIKSMFEIVFEFLFSKVIEKSPEPD